MPPRWRMAEVAQKMVRDSLTAMINRDVKLRPAIVSLESATLHRRHHLDLCAVEKSCRPAGSR